MPFAIVVGIGVFIVALPIVFFLKALNQRAVHQEYQMQHRFWRVGDSIAIEARRNNGDRYWQPEWKLISWRSDGELLVEKGSEKKIISFTSQVQNRSYLERKQEDQFQEFTTGSLTYIKQLESFQKIVATSQKELREKITKAAKEASDAQEAALKEMFPGGVIDPSADANKDLISNQAISAVFGGFDTQRQPREKAGV